VGSVVEPEVLIVNGPPGVGKTSVASVLRRLHVGTVAISGDALRAFAPPDARAQLGGGATYRVGGALAAAFLALGATRVIFDYVFLRASHVRYFQDALPPSVTVRVFTLWAPLEAVLAREEARSGPPRLGLSVPDSYREMSQNIAQLGEIVDNSGLDLERAAERIHELAASAARQ
jgi:predicted kinase